VTPGMLYTSPDRKWADAEKEFLEAQRLAPNLPNAYNDYAYMLIIVGRLPEAIAQIEHGLALDPLNPEMHVTYSLALFRARRFAESEENCRVTLELDPKNISAAGTRVTLAEIQGNYATALTRLEELSKNSGADLSRSLVAARLYARMGRRADAERTFANAMTTPGVIPLKSQLTTWRSGRNTKLCGYCKR
jgi:tetratricopeptide (TPR) repeat protein